MTWKILTAQTRERIYYLQTSRGLFPEEQKGYHNAHSGAADLLYLDQHIPNESKTRLKNPAMAWTDNRKAYDRVLQSWNKICHKMYNI